VTPAVVVLAYERPGALQRLLTSLDRATYPAEAAVTLVISLDRSESPAARRTAAVAHDFSWRFGPKRVIEQPEHLGVVGHFYAAGDLTGEYDDIVLLEDDLTVSPAFYDYVSSVLTAYGDDERVAGFCLYGVWFNGFTHQPFLPIEDGGDVFFMRVPYTQGLCFSARQWTAFREWSARSPPLAPHPELHPAFLGFGGDEWFPALASYLARTGRYFCFPRVSLTVGWGDAGAHFNAASSWFQTPLLMGPRYFSLPLLDEATAVYDGFFELEPERLKALGPGLRDREFDLDLNATKRPENLRSDLVLTTRPVHRAIARFGLAMYPAELNAALEVPGTEIALANRDDVRWDEWSETEARRRLHAYYWRRNRPSRARSLRFAAARVVEIARRYGR
jgi:hypothetical protein